MCGDVIGQECQRLPAPNLPSNASIGLDNRYFFLFFYLSSYFSFHLYFIYFLLLPLSSHLLLMSILVFLSLSANTYGVQHLLSSTLTAIHAVKDRGILQCHKTIFVNTAGNTSRNMNVSPQCLQASRVVSLCVARIRNTQLTILLHSEIQLLCRAVVLKRLFEL